MANTARPIEIPQVGQQEEITRPSAGMPWGRLGIYLVLILFVGLAIGPFLWMISSSLMTESEVNLGRFIPESLQFENYTEALALANFLEIQTHNEAGEFIGIHINGYLWNSFRLSAISIIGSLLVSIPAAYAFARMQFYGKDVLFAIMIASMMIPGIVMLIPHLLTVIWIGRLSQSIFGEAGAWFNNWPGLTIPSMASAFNIFLLRQFFMQIPEDLWDAARIDGASHLRFLSSVILPLSKAPIMTVITLEFIGSWNSLMWPILITIDDSWRPVAVGLTNFVTSDAPGDFNLQMAASVMMVLPILFIYFLAQKQFTEGIAQSGLKG